jgi:nucleoside-diphosphate kinase
MTIQQTFSIIKPDATARNITGKINTVIENSGLRIVAQKRIRLTKEQASEFYAVHKARPFYGELVDSMADKVVVVQVLEGQDAVAAYRNIMGATNPKEADAGTIRQLFALSIGENSVHGSDSLENAANEIAFFFSQEEIVG